MAYRFTARVVCGLDDPEADDCVMAGVAESEDAEAFSLLFMCDVEEPGAQETALGLDTYCLVTPGQGTAYGCVREAVLSGDVLRVTLDPASLEDLGLSDPVVEVLLRAPEADVARMREVLPRVLGYGRPEARPEVAFPAPPPRG
ncbi:Imm10 family immunity protein [Streptomyces sp. NPDC004042]|uniref:Imm10 family immunity protein n=1 Tax=Streptomyces sp. NPDC004042 TaxID=3154451 RepID=UPI0033ACC1B0